MSLNLQELETWISQTLVPKIEPKTILLLEGPLGAGKTQLVRFLVKAMGGEEISSPTFAIHNEYSVRKDKTIDHIDLYRLKDDEDLESTGFWDLFSEPEGLIIIEWSERLTKEMLPINWKVLTIKMQLDGPTRRLVSIH